MSRALSQTETSIGSNQPTDTIPFRLRIGVTGHRSLGATTDLVAAVDKAIDSIEATLPRSEHTPVLLGVVSPLGEGADRIVAERLLLRSGAILEAPLPFEVEEYEKDFSTEKSRQQFLHLLGRARDAHPLNRTSGLSRKDAYRQVGLEVLGRCDVLLAVWDGQFAHGRGGTGEIVHRAQRSGKPLVWIESSPPHRLHVGLAGREFATAFAQLDRYNSVAARGAAHRLARDTRLWEEVAGAAGVPDATRERISDWIAPHLARADALADRAHRRFRSVGGALFVGAAAAVAVAATVALLLPHWHALAAIEVALMLLALLWLLPHGRRRKLQWISYRFLAERFRAAPFLALAGVRTGAEEGEERLYADDPYQDWLARSFEEVWWCRPALQEAPTPLEATRRAVLHGWIDPQHRYYTDAAQRSRRMHHLVLRATGILFAVTLVAAALHVAGVGIGIGEGETSLGKALLFLSIVLPAIGAAVSGLGAQREYVRNGERFGHMATYLEVLREQVEETDNTIGLGEAVIRVEQHLRSENRDWIDLMRFHQLELHI